MLKRTSAPADSAAGPTESPLPHAVAAREVERTTRRPRQPHPPAPTGLDLERALTTRETGGILGHSEITLQQWRARGEGPRFFRLGVGKRPAIRYRLADVLAFRDANMVGKTS